jgi:chemotaxis protein methyltransferase CheR
MTALKKVEIFQKFQSYDDVILTEKMFWNFSKKIYELAGVDLPLTPKNQALVRNRIVKILRRRSLMSFEDYWEIVQEGGPSERSEFISALTTNMTYFYREPAHFDFLTLHLPKIAEENSAELRIWCAASSTGQEPYTIAMTACEALNENALKKVKILATDIDLQVLTKAAVGLYEEREMQGLAPQLSEKYFDKKTSAKGPHWRAKDKIHAMIRFAPFNLMEPKYDFKHKFNVIFCRNVLIYFDEATTKKVIENAVARKQTCCNPASISNLLLLRNQCMHGLTYWF